MVHFCLRMSKHWSIPIHVRSVAQRSATGMKWTSRVIHKLLNNIIEIQYKSETNLSESHTGWLSYLNHTGTVCTGMQMVTLPSK